MICTMSKLLLNKVQRGFGKQTMHILHKQDDLGKHPNKRLHVCAVSERVENIKE